MQFPLVTLGPEYLRSMAAMQFTRPAEIDATARRLLTYLPHYAAGSAATKVPALWLAPVGEREDGANIFTHYFGNGDPLDRPTTDVPRNRGPFDSFEAGLIDALQYDRIDQVKDWSWAGFCYEGEAWNGFGPREHGRYTGYLWSGSSIYTGGKYTSDNEWDPSAFDEQLGIVPVAVRMLQLNPSLALPGAPPPVLTSLPPIPPPAPPPQGLHDAAALQAALNSLGATPPLTVDNSYGRQTLRAVEAFQLAAGLEVDGLAGPETWIAINAKLKT